MDEHIGILKSHGKTPKDYFLFTFIFALAMATAIFLPFIISDQGLFLYYGDFNVQQVPFYQTVHDAIRSGNFMWSFTTDLGANTIASYSFYLLGSPFFWLTLPFPSDAVPYLMGPLLILKFACAALSCYTYLRRYTLNRRYAVLGGLLYAFSGFSVYNIFFNHFHEAIIIFPLLLAAIDEYMISKKRGLVLATVFFSCLMNYYFFIGQFVFCVIYWIIKIYYKRYRFEIKEFLFLLLEGALGVALTAVILVPTVICVMGNPRLDDFPYGWGTLLYGDEQRYLHILQCLFFPPDIPARPNFTPDSNAKWASLGAWLPFFGMTGVIAYLKYQKQKWIKTLLITLFTMALVPVLNSAFQLFNMSYYARWYYMLTLIMVLATVQSLESVSVKWKSPLKITFIITVVFAVAIGFMRNKTETDGKEVVSLGLMDYPDRFWIYVAIALLSLLLFSMVIRYKDKNQKRFFKLAMLSVAFISIGYSLFIIALGKSQSYDTQNFIIPHLINKKNNINLPDTDTCRIDVYDGMDNTGMFWNMSCIQAFHSIVPASIMEFYPSVGVERDVGSRPEVDYYGLRGLLSVHWLFGYDVDCNGVLPGFEYYDTQNGFDIFENIYYIPMGFSYDSYISTEDYNSVSEDNRHLLLLKSIVLDAFGQLRNKDILKKADTSSFSYTDADYYEDCQKLQQHCCTDFSRDKNGFSAKYTAGDKDELVFFSVPYEDGFTAYVNGQKRIIEKSNIGFMAVRVPANKTSTIRFEYYTTGLNLGLIISLSALGGAVLYILFALLFLNKKRKIRTYKLKK